MPSPIGHCLSIAVVLPFFPEIRPHSRGSLFLLASIFVANSPDIDFLFGFAVGQPNLYHHQFTHSFLFAAAVGLLFAALFSWSQKKARFLNFWKRACYFFLLASLHLVLDYFCLDTTPPYGLMLFWPWSTDYFISPEPLFSDIQRSSSALHFFPSLFSLHNGFAVFRELAGLGLLSVAGHLLLRARIKNKASIP